MSPRVRLKHGTCNEPDRDVPKLVCGYPMPCPHHTAVITEEQVPAFVDMHRWLGARPIIEIYYRDLLAVAGVRDSRMVGVSAVAHLHEPLIECSVGGAVWRGEREIALTAPISALRDAADELTREAHCEIEKLLFGDVQR